MKPVRRRAIARKDEEAAFDHYASEAGHSVADAFADALREVYRLIAERPAIGSLRYARVADLPDLRSRPVGRFPYLVFYIDREAYVEVWRVLHGRRDILALLTESGL